ncbi:MAG: hypothetical protein HQM00_17385 [Magnetococcales bacterium]|nr:hypothetical protein [Magnetococcales bacterium]
MKYQIDAKGKTTTFSANDEVVGEFERKFSNALKRLTGYRGYWRHGEREFSFGTWCKDGSLSVEGRGILSAL